MLTLGPAPAPSIRRLSPREQQIVLGVAQGLPNKLIARQLGISTWTVATYLRRIYARLGVNSRAAMVARLYEAGVLSPSAPASLL